MFYQHEIVKIMIFCRVCVCLQEEQAAKLKAENIRVALEKIKEAQVKKVRFIDTHTHTHN